MKISDIPLEEFWPVCAECGERCSGDCYKLGDEYYCEECMNRHRIDCYAEAEDNRDGAWEAAHRGDYD